MGESLFCVMSRRVCWNLEIVLTPRGLGKVVHGSQIKGHGMAKTWVVH